MKQKIIKSKIIESGYTQIEIAKMINVSPITVTNWVNGNLGNIEKFLKMCKLIDLNIDDLNIK